MKTLAERFWSKTRKQADGCWIWTGALRRTESRCVYGSFYVGGGHGYMSSHRMAWQLARGPIPDDLCVLHKCDVGRCVNPDHLYVGTQLQNVRDMLDRGREARGVQIGTAKLNARKVRTIRRLYASGVTIREIGKMFGMSHSHISQVGKSKYWSHIT